MMSVEGPYLAAVIARLAEPKPNLAAYGVAVAFALIVEAPVIMLMSASTALVGDQTGFRRLRLFTYALNALATGLMLLVLTPGVYSFLALGLIGLPPEIADLTRSALWMLLPWPAAIGYRRFYQGLLIRAGRTRLIAYGTVIRLVSMSATALVLALWTDIAGAVVGAASLSAGVTAEAIASRFMAAGTVVELRATAALPDAELLTYGGIVRFYYPLALTSLIGLAIHPMLTFFMGRANAPVESLAVYPVVVSLSFIFRSLGFSYQEVVIAMLEENRARLDEVRRFAIRLGAGASAGLALIAFTPLADAWFQGVSGLTHDLASFALAPTKLMAIVPALSVWLAFQRGILVDSRRTRPITLATAIEIGVVAAVLIGLMQTTELPGVTAAVAAFVVGRVAGMAYLARPTRRALDRLSAASGDGSTPRRTRREGPGKQRT